MLKYIAYCRKSTDEKEKQVLSIEAQIAELQEFASREGLQIVEFITESKTAKTPGREKFQEVLDRIENGRVNGIISWHPDRLARNSIDGGRIIYLVDSGKLLDLKFPSFWFDNTPQGKFMLSIAFSQSKYYVDNLSENVKRGNRQKLRNGVLPSKAPVGYLNNPKTRNIDVDPVKSKIIKRAFTYFASGEKSFADVSRFLYKHGVTTPSGKPMHLTRVRKVLTNKFYIGTILFNRELYKGSHKPIISKKLFGRVQKEIQRISKPRKGGYKFSFIGMARCGECGCAVTAEKQTKYYKGTDRTADYIYYHCTKKKGNCNQMGYLTQKKFDKQLRDMVSDVAIPLPVANNWLSWLEKDKEKDTKLADVNISRLKDEISTLDKKQKFLLDEFLDGVIEKQVYKDKKNEFFEKRSNLQEEINKIRVEGSTWLEPFREFVLQAHKNVKIASKKDNFVELRSTALKIGSNLLLHNGQIQTNYNLGYNTVKTHGGRLRSATSEAQKSFVV